MLASFVSEAFTQAIAILVILIHPPSPMELLEATTLIDTLPLPVLPLPVLPLPIPLTLHLFLGLS